MKFEIVSHPLSELSTEALIIFAFQKDKTYQLAVSDLPKVLKKSTEYVLTLEEFKGKEESVAVVPQQEGSLVQHVVVAGLGKADEFSLNRIRDISGVIAKRLKKKVKNVTVVLPHEASIPTDKLAEAVVEGILLGSYSFDTYRKKDEQKKSLDTIMLWISKPNKEITSKVFYAEKVSKATIMARNLVNEPGSVVTPTYLANVAQEIAKSSDMIHCAVYDKDELEKMGMNAFLGIARGAATPPKFIFLEYTPQKPAKKKIALVGKGITFDSGGMNLKPGDFMTTMKLDMSGAAAVLAVFSVLSEIKPDVGVIGLIAATPNLISGDSIIPGDVVKALNGKTIEVLNTDAEGRVTMADSLSFAVQQKADEIIDLATLTGACEVALGTDIAGMFGNNIELIDKLRKSAEETGEKVWELPLPKEYKKLNKSDVADIANIPSSRYGGAITAALFLEEFVDHKPWVHFDIAGPAFALSPHALSPKGGTGFGVRMLIKYLQEQ